MGRISGEMRRRKAGTLPRRSDILVRIRTHIAVYIYRSGSPFIPLRYCQRKDGSRDGVQRINEWDICFYPCIKERSPVATAPMLSPPADPPLATVVSGNHPCLQRSSHINEIIEGIDFIQTPPLLKRSRTPHFAAARGLPARSTPRRQGNSGAYAKSRIAAYAVRAVCRDKHRCRCCQAGAAGAAPPGRAAFWASSIPGASRT